MLETGVLAGTKTGELIEGVDGLYRELEAEQVQWRQASPWQCADGCGQCCVDFEPDVLESEALYLAAWLLEHQPARAEALSHGLFVSPRPDPDRGCLFFNPDSPWHCTVYEGRCFICRLFAYTGDRGKDGAIRWRPCKFLPDTVFSDSLPAVSSEKKIERKPQYTAAELHEAFGSAPPAMSDFASRLIALDPDGLHHRRPLREALPPAIAKIRMLMHFAFPPPEPNAPAPEPRAG